MTFDSVKGQRSSKKKARSTVLSQKRIEKKITKGQVRPDERPDHLRPQGSLPKSRRELCENGSLCYKRCWLPSLDWTNNACYAGWEQGLAQIYSPGLSWRASFSHRLAIIYCTHSSKLWLNVLSHAVTSLKGAKPSYHPECQKNNGAILQCAGLTLEIQLGKYSFCNLYYNMRNFCNLIGLEQWYFSLIWNTYMWKLQTLCR